MAAKEEAVELGEEVAAVEGEAVVEAQAQGQVPGELVSSQSPW